MRLALICYGILNSILYVSLLPLWEGFDEPFHYAYVQSLSHGCGWPVLRQTSISEEIWRSIAIAPGSYAVKKNLPVVTTYGEWFAMEPMERARLRGQLERLRGGEVCRASAPLNYEAQQTPLAYAVLAGPDWLMRGMPLVERVWWLRLLCAVVACVATALASFRLARQLKLPEAYAGAAVFVALSSQMFYATTAHVANDWLAIPLGVLLVSVAIDAWQKPGRATAVALAATLAAGLLAKAYFLSFVPFAVGLVASLVWKRRLRWTGAALFVGVLLVAAGPWYVRNVALYGSLSAMQDTVQKGSLGGLLSAALRLPWLSSVVNTARASLWTGNLSFTAFSRTTINIMLAAIGAAAVLYVWSARRNRPAPAEWLTIAAGGCYSAALAYSALVNFWCSKGESDIPAPWYVQLLIPILLCVLFLGLARGRSAGRVVAIAFLCLWAYVISATYAVKLIPLYSGYAGRAQFSTVVRWYTGSFAAFSEALDDTAMRGTGLLLALTAAVVASAFTLAAVLAVRLKGSNVR
jgi:hypothetical protein